MASSNKQYGLTVPKKGGNVPFAPSGTLKPRLACFADDSDSSDGEPSKSKKSKVEMSLLRESERSVQKKQTQMQMRQALDEDPTVYQYDEVYDTMEQKKAEVVAKKKDASKKPKYIAHLLKTAELRKMENERRVERQVQKEREEEGATFADKESFVTSAYRAKLEEFKQQEELEKKQDMIEAMLDVSKQKDLSGFYRHLYKRTIDAAPDVENPADQAEPAEEGASSSPRIKEEPTDSGEEGAEAEKSAPKQRTYRERRQSSSSSSGEEEAAAVAEAPGDSDTSLSSSSSDSESEDPESSKKDSKDNDKKEKQKETTAENKKDKTKEKSESVEKKKEPTPEPKEPPKPKINIWEKRTVGPVFEAALQRYYARKAARES